MSILPTITVLWKGTILGCCEVTLFISSDAAGEIIYDMHDTLATFKQNDTNPWLSNFKPIRESGRFAVAAEVSAEDVVDAIIAKLTARYAANTAVLYSEEIRNGYNN